MRAVKIGKFRGLLVAGPLGLLCVCLLHLSQLNGQHGQQQEDHSDSKKPLERISNETGGRLFEVSKQKEMVVQARDGYYAAK
jgi:hypothetical protein